KPNCNQQMRASEAGLCPRCGQGRGPCPRCRVRGAFPLGRCDGLERSAIFRAMEAAQLATQLSPSELEEARLAFFQLLRRKGMSRAFIERYAEDLFSRARLELTRTIEGGEVIHSPTGWLLVCAWRRTQNQLTSIGRGAREVKLDAAARVASPVKGPE